MTGQIKQRVQAIDTARGIIMIIMALDHVRDYFHVHAVDQRPTDLTTTTPLLFFTRWITHFCAPTFLFLSGISAYLVGMRKTKKQLSGFLIKRGLWLIVADATIMTFGLTFDPHFDVIFMLVLWSIGLSMIILGLMVHTRPTVIILTGVAIVFAHNIFDYFPVPDTTAWGQVFKFLVTISSGGIPVAGRVVVTSYAAIVCCGLLLLGYGAGQLYNAQLFTPKQRTRILFYTGVGAVLLFIVLRTINHYGDPSPAMPQKDPMFGVLSFFNATKNPMSLDFMCMTIGPSLLLLAAVDSLQNSFTKFVSVYGKVPLFYFIVHIYFIHILVVIVFFASGHGMKDIVDPKGGFYFRPSNFGYDLWVVYLIWAFVVLVLYKPCKWFYNYKTTHKYWWLSYI